MAAVQDVVTWWVAQMRDLLPSRLIRADIGDGLIADVTPGEPAVTLVLRRNRRETILGAAGAPELGTLLAGRRAPPRVVLRVPAEAVLERSLTLPIATEPELDRVVAYEIDRISPFAAGEVAFTFAVDQRDRVAGRLQLRIALLPRASLDPVIAALRQVGMTPTAVLASRTGGGLWHMSLLPPGRAPGGVWRRRAFVATAAACAVLAIVAAALPFVRQEAAIRAEEARIARLRPDIAQADALRRRIADRASGLDALAAESARVGQVLNVIATLTTLLPDDTYLTGLTLRQRTLTLTGRSASAARLIPLLAADPALRNAAFAAPVTRADGGRGDLFSIRAEFGS